MIYLSENSIEPGGSYRDVLLLQFRETILRNLFHYPTTDSGVFDTVEVAGNNVCQSLEDEAVGGIVLDKDVADRVAFDP